MAKCKKCDKYVSKKVETFSLDKYKKVLCYDCQNGKDKAPKESKATPKPKGLPMTDKDTLLMRQCIIKAVAQIFGGRSNPKWENWKRIAKDFEDYIKGV